MNQQLSTDLLYETNEKIIKSFSWKVLRRAHAAGAKSVQLDDIISECAMAWMMAVRCFNPERSVPFGAYLRRGMIIHINRWIQKEIKHTPAMSLDEETFEETTGGSLYDCFESTEERADVVLERKSGRKAALDKLKPRARQFVELLDEPPPQVVEAFLAIKARSEYARKRGISSVSPSVLGASFILDIMGAKNVERGEIYQSLRTLATKVNRQ